jgi:hypothetical protein
MSQQALDLASWTATPNQPDAAGVSDARNSR